MRDKGTRIMSPPLRTKDWSAPPETLVVTVREPRPRSPERPARTDSRSVRARDWSVPTARASPYGPAASEPTARTEATQVFRAVDRGVDLCRFALLLEGGEVMQHLLTVVGSAAHQVLLSEDVPVDRTDDRLPGFCGGDASLPCRDR